MILFFAILSIVISLHCRWAIDSAGWDRYPNAHDAIEIFWWAGTLITVVIFAWGLLDLILKRTR